jgi:predicted PurR-regulated permease PerM
MNHDPGSGGSPPTRPGWTGLDFLRAAGILAGVYVGLQLFWFAHSLFFLMFLGILFGLAMAPAVERMGVWGLPRGLGAASFVLGLLTVLLLAGALLAPTIQGQGEKLETEVPRALDEIGRWLDDEGSGFRRVLRGGVRNSASDPEPGDEDPTAAGAAPGIDGAEEEEEEEEEPTAQIIRGRLAVWLEGVGGHFVTVLNSTTALLGGILLTSFIAIYFAVSADTYERGVLDLIPTRRRELVQEAMQESAIMLRRWLVTQFITMLVIGVATSLMLYLLGVPAALALGVIAGLLEFIPIMGPIIASVPAIAMGFLVSPQTGFYVAIGFLAIQQVESQLLVPLLMKKAIHLPPLLTVAVQGLMLVVFGVIGLLVAVPLLATAIVLVKIFYVREHLGNAVRLPSEASAPRWRASGD